MNSITLIYVSNRPGGIDLLADSLVAQKPMEGLIWDLVVIDGWPGRVERGVAEEHLRSRGIPVRHYGVPMLKTFPWSRTGFANAMNTGVMYATGEYVVFLHDYTWYPPSAVGSWLLAYSQRPEPQKTLMVSVGIEYDAPPPDGEDDVVTWKGRPPGDPRLGWVGKNPWTPVDFDLGFWCAPVKFFEDTNGIDARADFCASWARSNVVSLARVHGYHLALERRICCHMVDHRAWVPRELPESLDDLAISAEKDSLYRTYGHLADITDVEPTWTPWACNPFNMAAVRRHLQSPASKEETP